MQSLFKQTRTRVHSPAAQRRERQRGLQSASRTSGAIQLGTQLLLWIFFFGYDQSEQAVWQAVLMLFVPLAVLWLIWRQAAVDHPSANQKQTGSVRFCLMFHYQYRTAIDPNGFKFKRSVF